MLRPPVLPRQGGAPQGAGLLWFGLLGALEDW